MKIYILLDDLGHEGDIVIAPFLSIKSAEEYLQRFDNPHTYEIKRIQSFDILPFAAQRRITYEVKWSNTPYTSTYHLDEYEVDE